MHREVRTPDFLSFAWSWDHEKLPERLAGITFESSEDGGSSVVVQHEAPNEAESTSHREGWGYFLDRLGAVLKS